MKKLLAFFLALSFSLSANALEMTEAEKARLPADEFEAADPFVHYPEAYQDNEYGQAAEEPEPSMIKAETPIANKVFGTDRRGNLKIK